MTSQALFPTFVMPQTITQIAQTLPPVAYPPSVAFDFEIGDFPLDGTGRLIILDGYAAWVQWCVKAALTARATYPIYSANYGADLTRISTAPNHAIAQSNAQKEISGAILADPRSRSVDRFTFTWSGDAVQVTFTITPTVGTAKQITVKLAYP